MEFESRLERTFVLGIQSDGSEGRLHSIAFPLNSNIRVACRVASRKHLAPHSRWSTYTLLLRIVHMRTVVY
jgi:hypothetical protein